MSINPTEHGYEYLQSLRVPAIDTVVVPPTRQVLAYLEQFPSKPLENDIHPLFQFYNWLQVEWEDYQSMLPALRIASLLVRQRSLLQWWKHTLFGDLRYDPAKGYYLAPVDAELTDEAHESVLKILNATLPRVLRLGFYPVGARGVQYDGMSFGSTATFTQFRAGSETPTFMVFSDPKIFLHSHYLWDLIYLRAHGSPEEVENVQLRIAITLCHELAHIVWKFRAGGDVTYTPRGPVKEPFHNQKDTIVEMGHSLEAFVFGGSIWAVDHPGHFTTYYTPPHTLKTPSSPRIRVVVPRWWLHVWFRRSTWDHFDVLFASGQLRLPCENESGYVFRKHSLENSLQWTLYIHGIRQENLSCMMMNSAAYILWNIIRPRKEKGDIRTLDRKEH